MNWIALARVLIEMFGPWLRTWLDGLLSRAADELAAEGYVPAADVDYTDLLFERAAAKTWRWQATRRRLLKEARRVASRRHAEIVSAARGVGSQPYLTRNEQSELASLV